LILQGTHARGRCAACKALFDPDLEQGANTNIVVHRDPATGDTTRVLVHRWCSPGRPPRPICAGRCRAVCWKPARTVLKGAGRAVRPARLPDTRRKHSLRSGSLDAKLGPLSGAWSGPFQHGLPRCSPSFKSPGMRYNIQSRSPCRPRSRATSRARSGGCP